MEPLQAILISSKIALSLGVLFYSSWSDYKTREVSNRVWAYYAPVAVVLSLAEILMFNISMLPFMGLSFGLTTAFALLLFYTGAFGGADSKAMMCIALALPFSTDALFTPLLGASVSPIAQYVFPLTIFSNSVLFAAASGIYMILRNIVWHKHVGKKMFEGSLAKESFLKKLLVLITGYPMEVGVLVAKWHVFPLEDVEETTGDRKLVIVPKEDGRDGIVERLNKAVEEKRVGEYVWATPGLPMLIFVTLGLVVAVFFGDIVWLLVRAIIGA
ncbi:MAG: A24 family peptidase C-terminal domain-containing protein [Candidatus Bathyarchaeia archaeon]|jgi:preflagellin peptidase FlaK